MLEIIYKVVKIDGNGPHDIHIVRVLCDAAKYRNLHAFNTLNDTFIPGHVLVNLYYDDELI